MSLVTLLKPKRRLKPVALPEGESGKTSAPASVEQLLEVHLAKPGGNREGPFSLDQVNRALAAGEYRSGDCWAWHKGLPEWVPLYEVKGIIKVPTPPNTSGIAQPERPSGSESESRKEVKEEAAKAEVDAPQSIVEVRDCIESAPLAPLVNLDPLNCVPENPVPSEPTKTPEKALENNSAAPDIAAESRTNQPEERLDGPLVPGDAAIQNGSPTASEPSPPEAAASSPINGSLHASVFEADELVLNASPAEVESAPAEPVEPLPSNGISHFLAVEADEFVQDELSADSNPTRAQPAEPLLTNESLHASTTEANALVPNAEPAAAILARLKESFFQTPEPSNEATSYFNARRVSTHQLPAEGVSPSEHGWVGSAASQLLEPDSRLAPHGPETRFPVGAQRDSKLAPLAQQFSSGMPFSALEQLFIFTTGDGPSIWSSEIATRVLEATIGENLDRIRQSTPRDVIFNCDLAQLLKQNGAISDAVWRAMAVREPSVVARAQQKLSRTFVRTFNLETDTVVAVVLFYNNQKLSPSSASP